MYSLSREVYFPESSGIKDQVLVWFSKDGAKYRSFCRAMSNDGFLCINAIWGDAEEKDIFPLLARFLTSISSPVILIGHSNHVYEYDLSPIDRVVAFDLPGRVKTGRPLLYLFSAPTYWRRKRWLRRISTQGSRNRWMKVPRMDEEQGVVYVQSMIKAWLLS